MNSKPPKLNFIQLLPGPAGVAEVIRRSIERGACQISALQEGDLRPIRDLVVSEDNDGEENDGPELVPFGKLVGRVAQFAGVTRRRVAQPGTVVAAIAEACGSLELEGPFRRGRQWPGMHRALARTLGELRRYGLEPADLELASDAANPHLCTKLRDLAAIWRESDKTLSQLGLEHLTDTLRETVATDPAQCQKLGRVLIRISDEIDPAVAEWLLWLAKTDAKLTVIGEQQPGSSVHFRRLAALLGQREAAPPQQTLLDLGDSQPPSEPEPTQLAAILFQETASRATMPVTLVSAPDVLSECEWAMRTCLEKFAAGVAPSEIAIIARDTRVYAGPLESASRRHAVQLSVSWRVPVLSNRCAAFILDLLEAMVSPDVRELIRPLSSVYAGLTPEVRATAEEVLRTARKAGIDAWQVVEGFAPSLSTAIPWFLPLMDWRSEAFAGPVTREAWLERLKAIAEIVPWQDVAGPEGSLAERDARAQSALIRSLSDQASVARVRAPFVLDFRSAVQWMKTTWADAEFSLPASRTGIVCVTRAAEVPEVKTVLVLGANEGSMPRRPREDPVLHDEDRTWLSQLRALPHRLPISTDQNILEREEFIRLCGAPSEELIVSYSLVTGEQESGPSAYLELLEAATTAATSVNHASDQTVADPPLSAADRRMAAALLAPQEPPDEVVLQSPYATNRAKWATDRPFELRQLRRSLRCPFQFFAQDTLGLRPKRYRVSWYGLLGLPAEASLATQPDPATAKAALEAALDQRIGEVIGRVADWELAILRTGAQRLIEEWVEREFAARALWPRTNMVPNVPMGGPGTRNTLGSVTVQGGFAALGRFGGYRMARFYERATPSDWDSEAMNDSDHLYYGLLVTLLSPDKEPVALEIETMVSGRRLVLFPRDSGSIAADPINNLTVARLGSEVAEGAEQERRVILGRTADLLREATKAAREADVRPKPGDHCAACDFGELCRRSQDFGESDDPFVTGGPSREA